MKSDTTARFLSTTRSTINISFKFKNGKIILILVSFSKHYQDMLANCTNFLFSHVNLQSAIVMHFLGLAKKYKWLFLTIHLIEKDLNLTEKVFDNHGLIKNWGSINQEVDLYNQVSDSWNFFYDKPYWKRFKLDWKVFDNHGLTKNWGRINQEVDLYNYVSDS